MFSLQTMTWAVGATAGPVFVTLVLARHSWRTVYLLLGVAFFPLLAVIWWLDVPDSFENEQSLSPSELKPFVKQPTIYGMGIALVIVGCIESVFFTWLPYYSAQFFTQSLATVSLSVYLVAYIPGRYVFSHLADRFPYTVLVRAVGGLTIAVLFGMFYLASGYQFLGLVFVSGLLISGLFPTLLTLGVEGTPEFSGPASALAMIFAQVGFFIGPAVVGVLADVYSIQQAMSSLQLLFAVLLTLVVLVLERRPLRHR
jgi:fucose permease